MKEKVTERLLPVEIMRKKKVRNRIICCQEREEINIQNYERIDWDREEYPSIHWKSADKEGQTP